MQEREDMGGFNKKYMLRAFSKVPMCSGRFFKLCNWQGDMVDVRQESSGKVDCYTSFYSVPCFI